MTRSRSTWKEERSMGYFPNAITKATKHIFNFNDILQH
uniref:Uncharacterized protein n=1 Tax=Anguilla anguilla TaxID=7936 RepID=A0A0E9WBI0_ANGAN